MRIEGGATRSLPHPVSPTISVTRFSLTFSTILSRSASVATGGRCHRGGGASSSCPMPGIPAAARSPPPPETAAVRRCLPLSLALEGKPRARPLSVPVVGGCVSLFQDTTSPEAAARSMDWPAGERVSGAWLCGVPGPGPRTGRVSGPRPLLTNPDIFSQLATTRTRPWQLGKC